jgi:hypothetical protein
MPRLTREQILEKSTLATEEVEVPEWGGSVLLRELSGKERDAFELSLVEQNGTDQQVNLNNLRARLVAWSVVDENGAKLFSTDGDVIKLGELSARALQRCFEKAQELSGLSNENVKELTIRLGEVPSGGSGSD